MKTIEYHHGGNWFDRLNNWLAVDMDIARTIFPMIASSPNPMSMSVRFRAYGMG